MAPCIERKEATAVSTAAAAVTFLGACLDYDESGPSRAVLRRLLSDDRINWIKVIDVANRHLVTPALWTALNRKGLTAFLPDDVQAYLAMLHAMNRQRNRLIGEQTCEAVSVLKEWGLRPVLMKGSQYLFEHGGDDGSRMMTDIDMLLQEEEIATGAAALRSLGYYTLGQLLPDVHAWTFHRPMSLATIDLHRHVGPQRDFLTASAARNAAVPLPRATMTLEGLCPTHRVLLLMMTFGIFERDYANGQIPLKGLHDLAALCARHASLIDWQAVVRKAESHGCKRMAQAWLHMAHCILGVPASPVLHQTAAARLHLRRSLVQLTLPAAERLARSWTYLVWPFNRFRMDYRYGCGLEGTALNAARLHHATSVLARHSPLRRPDRAVILPMSKFP